MAASDATSGLASGVRGTAEESGDGAAPDEPQLRFTIDELARTTSSTVRTIRSYQDRGLLPAPEIVGRTGYYGAEHVTRMRIIARLLDQRFSLAAIGALFQAWEHGQGLNEVLGFVDELTTPWMPATTAHVSQDEVDTLFPTSPLSALERTIELGILTPEGDGYRVLNPTLLEAGSSMVQAGVPLDRLLDEAQALQADCARIADRFVELFVTFIWEPYLRSGRSDEELRQVSEYLATTRPLPLESVSVLIEAALRARLEAGLVDLLDPAHESGVSGPDAANGEPPA